MYEAQYDDKTKLSTNYSLICLLLGRRRRIEVEEVKKERKAERKYYVRGEGAMRACETT